MVVQNLKLKIPDEERHVVARLNYAENNVYKLQQLIIIATGLYSHMDKESQIKIADSYQQAGFATLQFNFMGHGENQNKSEGEIKDLTLSSSIKDIKTVWDYSTHLQNIDTNCIAINANSYGALISLLALEKRLITPETMVLVAPYSFDKFKPWILPLSLLAKLMPDKIAQILKLPVSSPMVCDFLKHHKHSMRKKDLLGSTAVHFFVGADDKISSPRDVKKWCKTFNANTSPDIPFVDNVQAHCSIYDNVPHFEIPQPVQEDIATKSINFIRETRTIRAR